MEPDPEGARVDLVIGNLTYALILASYLVRDMMKLRMLAIGASLSSITFMFLRGVYLVVGWNLVFLAVNVIQVTILIRERMDIVLSPEDETLYHKAFSSLTRQEFRKIRGQAKVLDLDPGAVLVEEGTLLRRLLVVVRGEAEVLVHGKAVAQVKDGLFVGEMGFLTGDPATAKVVASVPIRVLEWETPRLREFLEREPRLRNAMQGVLGLDLTKKIRRSVGLATTAGTVPLAELTRSG